MSNVEASNKKVDTKSNCKETKMSDTGYQEMRGFDELFGQQNLTNHKMVVDGSMLRMFSGHDATLQQAAKGYERMATQQEQMLQATLAQNAQLFSIFSNAAIRSTQNGVSMDVQTLGTNPMEVAEAGISAKVAANVSPAIYSAVEAAVAKNVNNTETVDLALLTAIVAEVVASQK